jgi:hypothetical protein
MSLGPRLFSRCIDIQPAVARVTHSESAIVNSKINLGGLSGIAVYLSFLICALSGSGCHTIVPVEEPLVGMSACQMHGMMLAPQWLDQHPGWTIKRIRCSIGGRPPHDV